MGTIEGDIFNESNKGTFLTSLDNLFHLSLTLQSLALLSLIKFAMKGAFNDEGQKRAVVCRFILICP